MLTTAELQDIAGHVTYRPGWSIRVRDGRYEGQHVVITTVVPDAYDPARQVELDVHSPLPPMRDRTAFLDWLLWRVQRVESHEAREWLRVDGQCWSDPHAENADRDE